MDDQDFYVANMHVDLNKSLPFFEHSKYDFQVIAKYVDPRHYDLTVSRLDQNMGWNIPLQVMACDFIHSPSVHDIPATNDRQVTMQITTEYDIFPSTNRIHELPVYKLSDVPEPSAVSREEFNQLFHTDIVILPTIIYAAGIKDNKIYMYNEAYSHYHETIYQVKHILSVAILEGFGQSDTSSKPFYFIFAGSDGYPEGQYYSKRTIPKRVGEIEYKEGEMIMNSNEYPVFHSKKYVLTQSQHVDMEYTIGVPDRHFLFCNLYHSFRSFHQGIPFQSKIAKMVYASRHDRGQKQNFIERRDLGDMIPRQYFLTDAVDKTNVHYSTTDWITSESMVQYKYILDLDGRACTWDATAWKLNSGSVIMKQTSPWRQWFYDEYLPWTHYVPIANDFSDLQEKFDWCENHQEECVAMVEACLALFQKTYRFHNVIEYTKHVVHLLDEEN